MVTSLNGGFAPPSDADTQAHIDAQNHQGWELVSVILVGNGLKFFWDRG